MDFDEVVEASIETPEDSSFPIQELR
jgi:hypothetical protein